MRLISVISGLLVLLTPAVLLADGGTLRMSQRIGDLQVSAFTSPAVLRSGPIDVSVLIQDAVSGKTRIDVPVVVKLTHDLEEGGAERIIEQAARSEAASNKLFQAAIVNLPEPGKWHCNISIGEGGPENSSTKVANQSAEFDLVVSPPLPQWVELAPWIAWPFGLIFLFFVHQRLAMATAR